MKNFSVDGKYRPVKNIEYEIRLFSHAVEH